MGKVEIESNEEECREEKRERETKSQQKGSRKIVSTLYIRPTMVVPVFMFLGIGKPIPSSILFLLPKQHQKHTFKSRKAKKVSKRPEARGPLMALRMLQILPKPMAKLILINIFKSKSINQGERIA